MSSNYFYTQENDKEKKETFETDYHPEIIYNENNDSKPDVVSYGGTTVQNITYKEPPRIDSNLLQSFVLPPFPYYTLDVKTTLKSVFSDSDFIYSLWFLAIFLIIYFVVGLINRRENPFTTTQIIDYAILIIAIILLIVFYYRLPAEKKQSAVRDFWDWCVDFYENPITIFSMVLFLIIFNLALYLFEMYSPTVRKSLILRIIRKKVLIIIWSLLALKLIEYVFGFRLVQKIDDFVSSVWKQVSDDVAVSNTPEKAPTPKNEVFNISNNLYTYDDAQAICKSYGARLASYDDIEQSYNDGAEWCNYGWSDKQMAFFPTQKSTWNKLQKNEKTKNNCGRPGINGGYMANPYLKFGVNCFGQKPAASESDLERLKKLQKAVNPDTNTDEIVDKKVEFWKENADKLLVINSFNKEKWSEF